MKIKIHRVETYDEVWYYASSRFLFWDLFYYETHRGINGNKSVLLRRGTEKELIDELKKRYYVPIKTVKEIEI